MFYFDSSKEAVAESQRTLRDIASQQHAVMALFHPTLEECLARRPQEAVKELISREKDVTIQNMLEFLPLNSSQDEINKWYNSPYWPETTDACVRVGITPAMQTEQPANSALAAAQQQANKIIAFETA